MPKKKSLIFFLLSFFLLLLVPITSYAKPLDAIYQLRTISEDQVKDQDPEDIIFYDKDGTIKVGDFSHVFDYLKAKYGNENNQYANKTWNLVDKSGDFYDAVVFRQYIMQKTGFTGQVSTKTAKDIALIPDEGLNVVYIIQDYIEPFALLFAVTYAIKSFSDACKNFKTKKQLLISTLWMFVPLIIIANMTDITKLFCLISNNTIKAVTDIISIFADGTDGLRIIGFEDIIDAAKRADLASFTDSMGSMSAANFQTQFGGGFSTAASLVFMVIMYSGKLALLIYIALLPIAMASIPVGRTDSKGFHYFLTVCAMMLVPIFNIVLMTIGLELSTTLGNSNKIVGLFGTFIIPFATLVGMMQMKEVAKTIVKVAARKT